MSVIDLPASLARAVELSWTMEHGHGVAASPFSGITQSQRGNLERWRFSMRMPRLSRDLAQVAQGFFLRLEGNLNTFRMGDPAARLPLGRALGTPVLSAAAAPGDREISLSGFVPNVTGQLMAGDWIQLGDQLAKLRDDVDSDSSGNATAEIWPKVWQAHAAGTALIVRDTVGIFRFTSDFPEWAASADNIKRPYQIQLLGVQEVLA